MQFANPAALFWSLLAAPIVIFYIVKIRLRREPVSTVMFWNQVFEEKRPRSIWRRLRHFVSLMLQILFLALLVFALCDPYSARELLNARRLVVIVDNSASMRATDLAPNRLTHAKSRAKRLIRGLRLRDEMALITAGGEPRVVSAWTRHQKTLQRELAAIRKTDSPTRIEDALDLARRILHGHENARIHVLTDGCIPATVAAGDEVQWLISGHESGNLGITQFQVRRALIDPIGYQILVEIDNWSDQPADCQLELNLDQTLVDVIPLSIAAEDRWRKVVDYTSAEGGRLIAKLNVNDSLESDNQAVALLPRRMRQMVTIVGDRNRFIESALSALPFVDIRLAEQMPALLPADSLTVCYGLAPSEVPEGDIMFIDPVTSTDLWTVGQPVADPIVTRQQSDSPLMAHVQLENVLIPQTRQLQFHVDHTPLATTLGQHPVYALLETPGRRVLVLSANLKEGDLPLRTAFPILVTNAMSWFQGRKGELKEAVAAGSLVEVDLAADQVASGSLARSWDANQPLFGNALSLRHPDGRLDKLAYTTKTVTIGPLQECGVWQVVQHSNVRQPDTEVIEQIACNLANSKESDLRPRIQESVQQPVLSTVGGRPMWFYAVTWALALSTVEWFFYQRRWIG